jgi:hypothetical protein
MGAPPWRVAGTSIAGVRHANAGKPCQDRHQLHVTDAGALIAVVSDGAGSAALGGEGAALLCAHVVERLAAALEGKHDVSRAVLAAAVRAVRRGVRDAREAAVADGATRGADIAAYHATLVGAAMLPDKGGLFFHIGDGAALALRSGVPGWLLSPPSNGEYADTTYFFSDADWRRNLRFSLIDSGYDTIFVMSDGVTDLALSQRGGGTEPFLPFFEPIGKFLAGASREEGETALAATLDSAAVRERTTDDKTLVWATVAA